MIESNSVEVGSGDLFPHTPTGPAITSDLFAKAAEWTRTVSLALLVLVALAVRALSLGASGFSEDEIHKLRAVEAYDRLDFTANAEHPMAMKLACWASISAARWWNAHDRLARLATISPEAALRFPNALLGAATALVLVLAGELLFDPTVGWLAGLLWTFDVNASAINRIGKEDTFLVFFLLLATYFYERGKVASAANDPARERWYGRSGVAFGLMAASKYMPHFFGLHALFNVVGDPNPDDETPDKRLSFFLTMGGAFLAADFAVLLPATWRYIAEYARGDMTTHSGYMFAHHLYVNTMGATPWGLPPTFYVVFVATKVPLLVLGAAAAGVVWAFAHPKDRGAVFIRVFLVFTLLPYSLIASKFVRYMLPVLAVIDVAAAVGLAWVLRSVKRELVAALIACVVVGSAAFEQASAAPFYGLAENAIGRRAGGPGALFPDDEFYDAGVREAVAAIAAQAGPHAVVCSDAVPVVAEYLARNGRSDMEARSLAHDGIPMTPVETWIVAQDGHMYLENAALIDVVGRRMAPWMTVRVAGAVAARVYLFRDGPGGR